MRFYQLSFTLKLPTPKLPSPEAALPPSTEALMAHTEWFGTERDAVRRRLALFNANKLTGKKSDHPIWAVDIPTSKPGLLRWLQEGGV